MTLSNKLVRFGTIKIYIFNTGIYYYRTRLLTYLMNHKPFKIESRIGTTNKAKSPQWNIRKIINIGSIYFFKLIILAICLICSGFWAKTIDENLTFDKFFALNPKVNQVVPLLPSLNAPVHTTNVFSAFIFGLMLFFITKVSLSMAAEKLGILDEMIGENK